MTIHEQIARARCRLRDAGIDTDEAAIDARLLAQHVLGWDAVKVLTDGSEPASDEFRSAFDATVSRRVAREPLAYITGEKEFWALPFRVTRAVLIPRPETELLVQAALEAFPDRDKAASIIDVGTGSGCLAVALAVERPVARVIATDISEASLEVARDNATRHRVSGRVQTVRSDLIDEVGGAFDVIVANPPYIPQADLAALQPEVRDFEPAVALVGGHDGLDVIRRLVLQSVTRLRPGGYLMFEFGVGQEQAVQEVIERTPGLTLLGIVQDLQGLPRVVRAQRVGVS